MVFPSLTSGPLPHPEPARDRSLRARQACSEMLDYLAAIEGELSFAAGTRPERRPDWWLHVLRMRAGHLLVTLEDEDAASRY